MKESSTFKIYFAYSGRDRAGDDPVKQAIRYIIKPEDSENVSRFYVEETRHPSFNNSKRKRNRIIDTILVAFNRSAIGKLLYVFLNWSLGEWLVKRTPWRLETEDWKIEAEKLIEESDILVFLYSDNSRDEKKAENIKWEIKTAKRLNRNVILCSLDRAGQDKPPEWVKKVDNKAVKLNFTQDELRERIIRHDLEKYNFTSLNLRAVASKPESKTAERLFDQYKMYKEETEKLIDTRQTVSNYYLLMNGALLTLIGVMLDPDQKPLNVSVVLLLSSVAGIFINKSWLNMVNYYKNLNTSKQRLINAIEESMPLQLNSTEYYEIMTDPLNKGRHESFGEAMIPSSIHSGWGILFSISLIILLTVVWKLFWGRLLLITVIVVLTVELIIKIMSRLSSHT